MVATKMKINNSETLKQALANIRLANLSLSPEVYALLKQALKDRNVDTNDIEILLKSNFSASPKS